MTLRICGQPGCPAFTSEGYCPAHQPKVRDDRASASDRGYGAKWSGYSAVYRKRHPQCRSCESKGKRTPTSVVDHIIPVTGPDDTGFWETTNHQPLCRPCHASKTASEGRTSQAEEQPPQRTRHYIIGK